MSTKRLKNSTPNRPYSLAAFGSLVVVAAAIFGFSGTAFASSFKIKTPPNSLGLSNGLVSWWTMDGKDTNWGTGITADRSVSANNGTLINMSTTSSPVLGKVGQALNFDGSSQVVETTAPSALSGSSVFTVTFWAASKISPGAGGNTVVSIRNGTADDDGFNIVSTNSHGGFGPEVNWPAQSTLIKGSNSTLADGKYHFYVFVSRSATDHELFVDNVSMGTNNVPHALASPLTNITIGAKYSAFGGTGFNSGPIDDVRVYNRALSASEMMQLYNFGTNTHQNVSLAGPGLSNGLVGWWTFDGKDTPWTSSTAATTLDKSGNGNTGTLTNMNQTTAPAVGKIGQALKFDGSTQHVSLPSGASIGTGDAPFSIAFWIKTTSTSRQIVVGEGNTGDSTPVLFVDTSPAGGTAGTVGLRTRDDSGNLSGYTASTITVNDGKWHHVVVTSTGSASQDRRVYIDGSQDGSVDSGEVFGSVTFDSYRIGSIQAGNTSEILPFGGSLDDVRLYNRALPATEVKQLHLTGK